MTCGPGLTLRLIIALVFVMILFLVGFLISLFEILPSDVPDTVVIHQKGVAMEPTIHDGEEILVRRSSQFGRFDMVVYIPPSSTDERFLGRIVGLPGETVEITEDEILINGEPLDDVVDVAHLYNRHVNLPFGAVYILGDNRNFSQDSHLFGPVPVENIIGIAELVD